MIHLNPDICVGLKFKMFLKSMNALVISCKTLLQCQIYSDSCFPLLVALLRVITALDAKCNPDTDSPPAIMATNWLQKLVCQIDWLFWEIQLKIISDSKRGIHMLLQFLQWQLPQCKCKDSVQITESNPPDAFPVGDTGLGYVTKVSPDKNNAGKVYLRWQAFQLRKSACRYDKMHTIAARLRKTRQQKNKLLLKFTR